MPSIDPKTYHPKDDDNISKADFLSAMQQLIAAIKTTDDPLAKDRAVMESERLALEQERVKREMPENKQSPGISVFSYPEGEMRRPKPQLKCKFTWCGADETWETLTPEEIELRNKLEPGDYQVTKANGQRIPFKVSGKRSENGAIEQLTVWYPCKDEHKADHMPNTAYLRQVLGEAIPSTADLMNELAKLRAELETAKAGAARV